MKRTEVLTTNGLKEGKHLFKVCDIREMPLDETVPIPERVSKMIIEGLVYLDGDTASKPILHGVYALNKHECVDGRYTASMYDNMVFTMLDKLGITEDLDTEDLPELLPYLRGKFVDCFAVKNIYEKEGETKAYMNIVFTETVEVKRMLKIQSILHKDK